MVEPPRLTRRAFLGAAGASLVAVAAGCGGEEHAPAGAAPDAALLRRLLARERAASQRLRALAAHAGARGAARSRGARARRGARAPARAPSCAGSAAARRPPAAGRRAGDHAAAPAPCASSRTSTRATSTRCRGCARRALRALVVSIAAVEAEHVARACARAAGADPLDDAFPAESRA